MCFFDLAGGTFALYSLICRNSKVSAILNERQEEMELSAYKLKIPNKNLKRAQRIKEALESSYWAKTGLLSMALLGTCMVIGDGILTPCISGLLFGSIYIFHTVNHQQFFLSSKDFSILQFYPRWME